MSSPMFETFLEANPVWDELLAKVANEKARCEKAGEQDKASAWNKVEDLLYKEIDDLSMEWADGFTMLKDDYEYNERQDISTGDFNGD